MSIVLEGISSKCHLLQMDGQTPDELDYHPAFTSRTVTPSSPLLCIPPSDLRPPLVGDKDIFYNGNDVSKIFWRGMCCPFCGRLNSREHYSHWECFGCNEFVHGSQQRTIYTAAQLADPNRPVYTGIPVIADWVRPQCEISLSNWVLEVEGGWMRVTSYDFGMVGRVIHLVPSAGATKCADEIFYKYQTQGIPFRRSRMMNGKGMSLFP
jgi:hypothetical protein